MGFLALGCGPETTADSGSASSGATSSTGDDPTTGDPPQASLLEQCDAPAPCEPVSHDPGSNFEEVDPNLECAIQQANLTFLEDSVAELTASYCDIGCSGTDVLLVGGSALYLQTWTTTDVTSYEEITRCTLQGPMFFEQCQGQPLGENDCASFSDWATDCEPVDTVNCP